MNPSYFPEGAVQVRIKYITADNKGKEYICIEMKVDERRISKDIFPLAHSFTIINTQNYFKEITRLFLKRIT